MIDISTIEVSGFMGAILGMRNPFKNREKLDSRFVTDVYDINSLFAIGPKDLELCQKLLRAGGDDDSKFMRMIHVQADVDAPLYWWKEFDTYKIATVANSESTMHTIIKHEFTKDDFSFDGDEFILDYSFSYTKQTVMKHEFTKDDFSFNELNFDEEKLISDLNLLRDDYILTKESDPGHAKKIWRLMIQRLPESYMQLRTIDLNYQTLRRIYFARKGHKLVEWHKFCDWIKTLPYAEELITYDPCNVQKVGGSDASN